MSVEPVKGTVERACRSGWEKADALIVGPLAVVAIPDDEIGQHGINDYFIIHVATGMAIPSRLLSICGEAEAVELAKRLQHPGWDEVRRKKSNRPTEIVFPAKVKKEISGLVKRIEFENLKRPLSAEGPRS